MEFRLANGNDLLEILNIYECARSFMRQTGNPNQWGTQNPPQNKTISDLENKKLYVATANDEIAGVFYFAIEEDPTYTIIYDGKWLNDRKYGVIHRIAVSPNFRGKGLAGHCFNFAFDKIKNIKIDTHKDNIPMQRALEKHGFIKCGIIHLANGDERIAYQKSED